jgi:predicted MFS family arabinose efflux permease
MNATIRLLSLMSFVVVAVMTVTGPLLPMIAHDFSVLVGQAGIVVSAFAVPYGLAQLFCGPLGDRIGKLRVIAFSVLLSVAFVVACGLSESLGQLTVFRFLSGLFMAGTIPLAMAYIADEVPYDRRQLVIGRYINGIIWGNIAGATLGGFAVQYFEWRQVFFFLGILCGVIGIVLWTRSKTERVIHTPQNFNQVLRLYAKLFTEIAPRTAMIAVTAEGFLLFGAMAYFGAYLRQNFGLDYSIVGMTLAFYGIGGLAYVAGVKWVVPRLGERKMVVTGGGIVGCSYFALSIAPVWWFCLPIFLFAGFGFYLIHNTMQTRATEMSLESRGATMSLWAFMLFFGQGCGVLVFGKMIDNYGYTIVFTSAGIGMICLGVWFQNCIRILEENS